MLLDDELCHGAAGIDSIEAEVVLMTVHSVDNDAHRVVGGLDARHVAVSIEGHLQAIDLMALDVVAPSAYGAVVLASLRILVRIESGIGVVLFLRGLHALIHLERVSLDLRLVVTQPANHRAVSIEGKSAVEAELLLIHPVG